MRANRIESVNPVKFFAQNWQLYKRLLLYVKPYWVIFAGGMLMVVIYSATTPGVTILMKPLLDGTFVEKDPVLIIWMPILLIGIFVVRGSANYLNGIAMGWLSQKIVLDLRTEMIERIVCLPTRFYDNFPTGQLTSRVTGDVNGLTQAATKVFVTVVRETLTIIGLTIWLFILDWVLSLTLIIATPLVVSVVYFIAIKLRHVHRERLETSALLLHHLNQVVVNNRVIKLYRAQKHESNRLVDVANRERQLHFKAIVASGLGVPIAELIGALVTAGAVYFSLTRDITDPLTVGGFVSFMTAMALMFSSIKKLIALNNVLQSGLAASERVFYVLDQDIEADEGARGTKALESVGRVAFENVSFTYANTESRSLHNVSLELRADETVALVGISGSGKSTLTALIPRLYELQHGRITIDDIDIRDFPLNELRQMIAYVSQDTILFDDTVEVNISYGNLNNATHESVRAAAESAYATEFIDKLPKGMQTMIGERGVRLSGGQKQRIAIAQAFLKDAPIVIFDEATSALDMTSEHQVRKAVRKLSKGRALLIISHRLSSLTEVDRIVVIHEGAIVEQGTHLSLLQEKGHYYALYTVDGNQS